MEPPIKPEESDCCNSGCSPCILDVYERQLRKYERTKLITSKPCTNCISPTSFSIFELTRMEKHSKATFLYTFKYVQPLRGEKNAKGLALHYEPGQHFLMKADNNGEEFTRAYTPIPIKIIDSLEFTMLIKLYDKGKMSNYLRNMQIGNETLWRGPYGEFKTNYNLKNLLLVAQGTGIAPIYSVIHDVVNNEECYTFLKLFYCCRDNIYLRDQLYSLSSSWNFTYEVFLSRSENICTKYNEIVHQNKLQFGNVQTYLSKCDAVNVLICGSELFSEIIKKYVLDCGVKEKSVFIF